MAMGQRKREQQADLWRVTADLPGPPGHPFCRRLNGLLAERGFDAYVEGLCRRFGHEELGRKSIPPGVYFRMLLIGYFEGTDSERGIAWRCDDSRTLREFPGSAPDQKTPDHSSLSIIRRRIDLETHQEVFAWVLKRVAEKGRLTGKTLGIDAATLEANAAMRSIVRRDTGESYNAFRTGRAQASGIATPTREDWARMDRKRKKKGSNEGGVNPNDPEAKVAKRKDGRTHLAHKAEHAADLDSGAMVAVTLQGANPGDPTTVGETLRESVNQRGDVKDDPQTADCLRGPLAAEVVADKGYHSNDTCRDCREAGIRTYCSEPKRGRREWKGKKPEQEAVCANRRRIRGRRGKALLRKRGELLERPFAHCYETGGMRRTHLRGHRNILKRLLIHVCGFNLALIMRAVFGIGKPRRLQDGLGSVLGGFLDFLARLLGALRPPLPPLARFRPLRVVPELEIPLRPAA